MSKYTLSIGIIGLPNVGKSTLFNALLKRQQALAANYPFATIEPNVGVVDVPDSRLDRLVEIVRNDFGRKMGDREVPEKVIPAVVKFHDIAGLVKGAHEGEGLGNEFLGHIRQVDAILHVGRAFTDTDVVQTGTGNFNEDIDIVETELIFADLNLVEKQIAKLEKDAKRGTDKEIVQLYGLYSKINELLSKGSLTELHRYIAGLGSTEASLVKGMALLSTKPVIYIRNIDEKDVMKEYEKESNIVESGRGCTLSISARIESELCSLDDVDREAYMKDLGINSSGLDRIIREGYKLLDLETYFTIGPKEVRAWTITKGTRAPQAAGKIHTDFERGFISASVMSFADIDKAGSEKVTKEQGLVRLEGKNYIFQDGDVVEFRFSV